VDVEEQLRRSEKLSALGLLAAEVAHEIRNPLTVLKMLYHSLDLKFAEGDPRAKDARIIEEKIGQLNRIVERVLDFARTAEPAPAPADLGRLIEELGLLVRHKLKHQNIRWEQEVEAGLPPVPGVATQLEQAFLNLILNAAEAMPGGGALTITARSVRSARGGERPTHVAVEFRDTGPGMGEEQRRGAFKSVLSTTKAKGTGLGLAIVARVVEAHRGKVRIRSRAGQGTTVSVVLPV
jgi:signal transduction histidine kinase